MKLALRVKIKKAKVWNPERFNGILHLFFYYRQDKESIGSL